jgi:hypothetical protein
MTGDERTRFCSLCKLHVYNFSEMTMEEVRALVSRTEGRVCGRLYRRADGTVITRDCPVALRAVRRRIARTAGATLAAIISLFAAVGGKPKTHKGKQCTTAQTLPLTINRTPSSAAAFAGRVLDANGAAIERALVRLRNEQTGATLIAASTSEGAFTFAAPSPGDYTVSVFAAGFAQSESTHIRINANEAASTDIVLPVGGEVVTETMGIIAMEDPPFGGPGGGVTTFNSKQITSLPIR